MIALTSVKSVTRVHWPLIIFLTAGLVGAVAAFPGSYFMLTNVLVGLCIFPFVLFVDGKTRFNYVYLITLSVFCFLAYRYDIKIFYFFALAGYVLFMLEVFVGRINPLVLFLIAVASPVFTQVSVILSFPIRLMLSEWACTLLSLVGMDIRADGNMILFSGYSFTVDDACMGLSMMAISLLMGVFIIAWHYKHTNRKLSFGYLFGFFMIVLGLNIIANLFRIMLLVLFQIPPENIMHEVVGIACMIFYTMVPLYFMAKGLIRWKGTHFLKGESERKVVPARTITVLTLITLTIVLTGFAIDPVRTENEEHHARVSMAGMQLTEIERGITKLTNDDLLIYIKPIPEFFTGEHTPVICWKGSGFAFKQIRKDTIAGKEIFTGVLIKENVQLHTAWWYTNGKISTIDQLTWRSNMLTTGGNFCLVNVTASDENILHQKLEEILIEGSLKVE